MFKDKILKRIIQEISNNQVLTPIENKPSFIKGLSGSLLPLLISQWSSVFPILVIADDADEAGYIYSDIEQALSGDEVLMFPSSYRRAIKYGHRDEANILMRSMVMSAIATAKEQKTSPPIIVSYPEAVIEAVAELREDASEHLILSVKQKLSPLLVIEHLNRWGYERCDYVYEPGQFALRGSILDVYSYASELPYRIDYWDDEIDSLRVFEVESQLSVKQLEQITLIPNLGSAHGNGQSLLELLPITTRIIQSDEYFFLDKIKLIWEDSPQVNDGEGFNSLSEIQAYLVSPERLSKHVEQFLHIYYKEAPKGNHTEYHFLSKAQPLFGKDYKALSEQIEYWQMEGYKVFIAASDKSHYERACEIIREHNKQLVLPSHISATIHEGFVLELPKVVLLTEHQIFGRFHKYNLRSDKARSGKITLSLKELQTFNLGDLVVHADHGVGRFGGLLTMDLGGRNQECVKIEYNRGDTIYVNLHSLHKLSHYRQKEAADAVTLSTLGSGAWQRLKEKTKKQVKDIARDLIKLYAKRKESQGFAYNVDTYLQHELEASFIYEETPDQRRAINDIKKDMECPYPMDRLLCGDVGFGKTEVAIRAAFKAACDSKQVAVLVPTTVLAYQHYRTFKQRLEGFPVRVEYLSRSKNNKEIRATLEALKSGTIDIIIGTHRLTSKDVVFRDLGLLIIDEEQKFGVATKEKLRKLQVNVDTLAMSATPIPRTLQFSLMGARDLSNLNTPPSNRVPVETILTRFATETLSEAINFELSRNGQVYVIHNRIQNIQEVAAVIQREVPDARVVIGHGQMPPNELEQILIDFSNHDYDVLVATTIIENGIDVPNANTILINDAHRYGLSELHQLRGRVGRSSRKAFCYLLTPPLATLSEESRRRVRAIENFSDLGSGVRIALQDLDIRGAGNALGAEQSGFIADMGYETYQKVFNEAIRELKIREFSNLYNNEQQSVLTEYYAVETSIESDLELALPEDYVPNDAERITLYRELDELELDEELTAYRERLVDRFGTPPEIVEELISVPRLRRMGQLRGFEKISLRTNLMNIFLPSDKTSDYYKSEVFGQVLQYVARNSKRCEFRERNERPIIRIKEVTSVSEAIEIIQKMLV